MKRNAVSFKIIISLGILFTIVHFILSILWLFRVAYTPSPSKITTVVAWILGFPMLVIFPCGTEMPFSWFILNSGFWGFLVSVVLILAHDKRQTSNNA